MCWWCQRLDGAAVTGVDRCHAHGWNINETMHLFGVWVLAHCWVLEQQATTTKNTTCWCWCGVVVSLVVPDLIQHATVALIFRVGVCGVVGGCGVVVWLLHSGREHLVRMTPVWVLFSCM